MKKIKTYWSMLIISGIYGFVFAIGINLFFDRLVKLLWNPLLIALIFLLFSIPLAVIIYYVSKSKGTHCEVPMFFRSIAIIVTALFLMSGVFEMLYEINANVSYNEADSYIFLIDDSGSMQSSDPQNLRVSSIKKLLSDKNDNFTYSVYTFSDSVSLPISTSTSRDIVDEIELCSNGGTAIFGVLNQVIQDINGNTLKKTSSTRVILLSDGAATDIGLFDTKLNPLLREYGSKELIVSTIGLGNGVNSSLMKRISSYTGGVYIHISDISELDNAMVDASINLSNRNLLSFRGFCKTNTLHAIMRILFLIVLALIVSIMKLYAYGKYYKKQIVVTVVTSVGASILIEVMMENMNTGEFLSRIVFFLLLSLTLIESYVRTLDKLIDGESSGANFDGMLDGVNSNNSCIIDKDKQNNIVETKHLN